MNGKTKTDRHQERKDQKRQAAKKRKAKTTRFQTEARRRQADLEWRKRQQQPGKARPLAVAKTRRQAVRRYRHLKEVSSTEREAAEQAAREYETSPSTLRRWDKLHRQGGLKALLPQTKRPKTVHHHIPLVVLLRLQYGWGQRRLSAELKRRQIYSLSHRSVRKILDAHPGITIRTYHPQGKSNGIAYRRWGRSCPNDLWHIYFRYLVASDLSWRVVDVLEVYGLRWLVEVFFQDWKSYEGWGQLTKQPDQEGSSRSLILSLLLDHSLLFHPEQLARLENKLPAITVGSMQERIKVENLLQFIQGLLSEGNPEEKLNCLSAAIVRTFYLFPSKKYMVQQEVVCFKPDFGAFAHCLTQLSPSLRINQKNFSPLSSTL